MWSTTEVTKKLGIKFPIIQAPMAGGPTTPELIAGVSNAGGLGSLGAGYMPAGDISNAIKLIRKLTANSFAVNLFIPEKHHANADEIQTACAQIENACQELNIKINPPDTPYAQSFAEQIEVVIAEKVPVFSFTFGLLADDLMRELKANKTILIGTATNLAEAKALEKNGVDMIVAQGSEAGGHRGTFLGKAEDALHPVSDLIAELTKQIKLPIIAAGGIMDGQGIKSALSAGACAAQMGTAFLSCEESAIHADYKKALLAVKQDNTVLTRAFSGKLARGINNQFISRMHANEQLFLDYPIQNAATNMMRNKAKSENNIEFMSLYAGQAANLSTGLKVSELMQQLIYELN